MSQAGQPRGTSDETEGEASRGGIVRVMSAADRRSWSLLRGHFAARITQNRETAYGSCRSRGRRERAHRSLENQRTVFHELPQAPLIGNQSVTHVPG